MAFPKGGLSLLVLLCCYTSSLAVSQRNEKISESINPSDSKEIVQGTMFVTDHSSYPYAICDWTKPKVERTCRIKLVNNPRQTLVCNGIKVFTEDPDRELFFNGYFQVIPFSNDHVVLAWWDTLKDKTAQKKQNFKVSIVNMKSCKTAHLDYPIDDSGYGRFPSLLLFPNQVDVIVNSKSACAGDAQCRLSYDLDGKQTGKFPYDSELLGYANPVSESGPDKGFFVSVQDQYSLSVLLFKDNGDGSLLTTDYFESDAVKQLVYFNSAHEKYTICRMPDMGSQGPTNVYCNQYNSEGEITIEKTITFPETVNWIATRSLAEGGFLLASAGCDVAKTGVNCQNFRVWKVRENGEVGKPTRMTGPNVNCKDMSSNMQVRITEAGNQFCFDFSCVEDRSRLEYTRNCLSKDGFA